MSVETAEQIINRLVEGGLDEKFARIILALCAKPPLKASEIGKLVSISRMDAYNSLKKLLCKYGTLQKLDTKSIKARAC